MTKHFKAEMMRYQAVTVSVAADGEGTAGRVRLREAGSLISRWRARVFAKWRDS